MPLNNLNDIKEIYCQEIYILREVAFCFLVRLRIEPRTLSLPGVLTPTSEFHSQPKQVLAFPSQMNKNNTVH
jgi:hypothetical protein